MTVFSFHPVKAIAAGEGGIITTNDEQAYRKLLRLRSHGINKLNDPLIETAQSQTNGQLNPWYYEMQELGFHYRITDIQSALAFSQFGKLDQFISRRRELAKRYDAAFSSMKNFRPAQNTGRDRSGHHLYLLRIDFASIALNRAQLMRELNSKGIGSQVHYIPVPNQPYYRQLGHSLTGYPHAQQYYQETLSIPLFYDLTNERQDHIISCISEILESEKLN
jgi:dTDP-4-amino-4,6-dideoxygalactose transaminase